MNKRIFSIFLITILSNIRGMETPWDRSMENNEYVKELHEAWPEFDQSPERKFYLQNCINGDKESCKKLANSLDDLHLVMKKKLDELSPDCKFYDELLTGEVGLPHYTDEEKKSFHVKLEIFFNKWDVWYTGAPQKAWRRINQHRNHMGLPTLEFDANKTGAQVFFVTYLELQEIKNKANRAIAAIQYPITNRIIINEELNEVGKEEKK